MKLAIFDLEEGLKVGLPPDRLILGSYVGNEKICTVSILNPGTERGTNEIVVVQHPFEEALEIVNLALAGYSKEAYDEYKKSVEELKEKMSAPNSLNGEEN